MDAAPAPLPASDASFGDFDDGEAQSSSAADAGFGEAQDDAPLQLGGGDDAAATDDFGDFGDTGTTTAPVPAVGDGFGDFDDASAAPAPAAAADFGDFGDFGEDFGTPRPGASDAFAAEVQAGAGNAGAVASDGFDDFGDFGASTAEAASTAATSSGPSGGVDDDFFGTSGDAASSAPASAGGGDMDFFSSGGNSSAVDVAAATAPAAPAAGGASSARVAELIAAERLQDAVDCGHYEATESDWTALKTAYDEAKEDDELEEADRLRQAMLDAGWQPPKVVKAWAKPPEPARICMTLAAMRESLEGGAGDAGACAAFRSKYPRDDHLSQLALSDGHDGGGLQAAVAEQAQALYWHGFFTSILGKDSAARQALVDRWSAVLAACVAEVSTAVSFLQECSTAIDSGVGGGGYEELLGALSLTVPTPSTLVAYLRGVVEVVRIAARIGVVLSCHQPVWMDQGDLSTANPSNLLSTKMEEVKAQYSVLTSTLAALPGYSHSGGEMLALAPPSELFGNASGGSEKAFLMIMNRGGFPGVEGVCALTLHRLQEQQEQEQQPPAVHDTVVWWQGARYFAPCANMLANHKQLQPPTVAVAAGAAGGAGGADAQQEDDWSF